MKSYTQTPLNVCTEKLVNCLRDDPCSKAPPSHWCSRLTNSEKMDVWFRILTVPRSVDKGLKIGLAKLQSYRRRERTSSSLPGCTTGPNCNMVTWETSVHNIQFSDWLSYPNYVSLSLKLGKLKRFAPETCCSTENFNLEMRQRHQTIDILVVSIY